LLYAERKDQGKYPVAALLYDPQHRKDSALWARVCSRVKEKRQRNKGYTPFKDKNRKNQKPIRSL
jgi:hypothetical protein